MEAEVNPASPATTPKRHAAFFRQSGWMMIAAVSGGALTWAVHFLAKNPRHLPPSEYAIFGTLLSLTVCIPAMPLQMVFSHQTAAGLALNQERKVAGMIRLVGLWTFLLWLAASIGVLAFQNRIAEHWHLSSVAALWWTLLVLLVSLWLPLLSGVLQGQQNFFWVGWVTILGGGSRIAIAALFVLAWKMGATGMMIGVFAGYAVAAGFALWQTRGLWSLPAEAFDKRNLFDQIVPLMLGFGAFQFIFSADTMFSQGYFDKDEMACYVAAGTMSRALLWLVLPLAQVMFPKLVHSTAKSEHSNLQNMVLLGTLVLGVCGAAGVSLVGPWVVRIPYPKEYVAATTALLPWYAWAMVPLAVGNVMISNLLARSRFRVVPVLILLAIVYGITLTHFHKTPVMVLQVMGAFNLLLVAACAWFTWGTKNSRPQPAN